LNTNRNTDTKKNMSENYSDIYRLNIFSLFSSVYIEENFLSLNTKGNTVENEEIKKITCHYYMQNYRGNMFVANTRW